MFRGAVIKRRVIVEDLLYVRVSISVYVYLCVYSSEGSFFLTFPKYHYWEGCSIPYCEASVRPTAVSVAVSGICSFRKVNFFAHQTDTSHVHK